MSEIIAPWNPANTRNADPVAAFRSVTPNDDTDLPDGPCRALNVGTAGEASVVDMTGTTVTIYLTQGWNPCAVRRVRASGLEADDIVACYSTSVLT
jgi:hypothetical protein